jgi:hypothetical protein
VVGKVLRWAHSQEEHEPKFPPRDPNLTDFTRHLLIRNSYELSKLAEHVILIGSGPERPEYIGVDSIMVDINIRVNGIEDFRTKVLFDLYAPEGGEEDERYQMGVTG